MCGIFFFRMIYEKIKLKPYETQPSIGRIVFRVARSYMQSLHIYRNQWTSATSMCPSPINEYEIVCESEAGGGRANDTRFVQCVWHTYCVITAYSPAPHSFGIAHCSDIWARTTLSLSLLFVCIYLFLCIVSPCKLTEWMSKYILCAV